MITIKVSAAALRRTTKFLAVFSLMALPLFYIISIMGTMANGMEYALFAIWVIACISTIKLTEIRFRWDDEIALCYGEADYKTIHFGIRRKR